jgi:hypothetical protein
MLQFHKTVTGRGEEPARSGFRNLTTCHIFTKLCVYTDCILFFKLRYYFHLYVLLCTTTVIYVEHGP